MIHTMYGGLVPHVHLKALDRGLVHPGKETRIDICGRRGIWPDLPGLHLLPSTHPRTMSCWLILKPRPEPSRSLEVLTTAQVLQLDPTWPTGGLETVHWAAASDSQTPSLTRGPEVHRNIRGRNLGTYSRLLLPKEEG